jgi:lipoprotein signal peptidase
MAVVAGADLLTKEIASTALRGGSVSIAGPLEFVLVQNRGSAFGISLGAYNWELNALATLIALGLAALAVRALSTVDSRAPIALGMIAGAAAGNLASLLAPPPGVTDFLSVRFGHGRLIMNLADIVAYAGLAMTMRSVALLWRAIAAKRKVRRAIVSDIPVAIPLAVERAVHAKPVGHLRERGTVVPAAADHPPTAPHNS